jgi:hypothetical protein
MSDQDNQQDQQEEVVAETLRNVQNRCGEDVQNQKKN